MATNTDVQVSAWKVGVKVGILLAALLFVLTVKEIKSLWSHGKEVPIQSSFTITGHGEEVAIPDVATFSFSVIESAKTLDAARTLATAKINKAIAVLDANNIAKNDMKTLSYNVNPKYDYIPSLCTATGCRGSKQVLVGYEVSQTLEVKVRDVTKVGDVFSAIGDAGVSNVGSLQFTVDKKDSIKDAARLDAIADARARADLVAKSLGVKIVRVVSYYDSSSDNPTPMYYAKSAMMDGAVAAVAPQVPTGEQKITSDVSVTYEIR